MSDAATAAAETPAAEPTAPATETPEPAAASALKTREERMAAAMAKGKAVAAEKNGKIAEEPTAEATAADNPEETTEAGDADPDAEATQETKQPKTQRARQWADLKKKEETVARREREAKRIVDENTKMRADLQIIQQELMNLNKLRKESPKKFIDAIAADSGGMRRLFEEALQEEKRTPEEEEKLALKRELEEIKAWRKEKEEAEVRWKKDQEARQAQQQTQQWHETNYKQIQDGIAQLVTEGGYPNVRKAIDVGDGRLSARRLAYVSGDVYNRILATWNDGAGPVRPISEVLDVVEEELAKDAGSAPPQAVPSARANGAEPTAKPEAKPKRTPPTLTNAHAAARASQGRELKGDERKRFFASRLGKVQQ